MGNQATSMELSTGNHLDFNTPSSSSNRRNSQRLQNHQQLLKNTEHEQIQSTLINCFALGDDMIYYLWKFYDLDHNNELDEGEMKTFLTELIHTLHDVCLRSELNAFEIGKRNASNSDQEMNNLNSANHSTSSTPTTTNTTSTTASSTSTTSVTIPSEKEQEKKKSRFGFSFKKKEKRMSTDLNDEKNKRKSWRRSRNLSDELKRRSVAVIPGAGMMNSHNFQQMITGNTEQDEIRKRWNTIREHMESNIDEIIKSVDKDNDGTINYQEFLDFMKTYDIKRMLNNMDTSLISPRMFNSSIWNATVDENLSECNSPRPTSPVGSPTTGSDFKENKRKSAMFQVFSNTASETSLPSLDLPTINKKQCNRGDLLNTVIFASGQETLEFLKENSASLERVELNSGLRRAIVDNNPSKTRALLKYGASLCQSALDENQEENSEGFDLLTHHLLKSLSSYSPCMDGDEIEKFQLILRLLISKGWFQSRDSSSSFKELTPDVVYNAIVNSNDSMSMYEDELRDALSENRSFEDIEREFSSQLED